MRIRRYLASGVTIAVLAATLVTPAAQAARAEGDFIVVLKDSVSNPRAVATKHKRKHGAEVGHVYKHTIKAYSARLSQKELRALRADPKVARIVKDGIATIAKRPGNKPPKGGSSGVGSWGLDRIDEHYLPMNGMYNPAANGRGVKVFVLDTGVRISHNDFGGRADDGWDFVDDDPIARDCHGHGTHVAATIGGTKYGVAKAVDIVAVRVLNCAGSGSWSDIIAAVDWVASSQSGVGHKVVNLSLSGPAYPLMDAAVNAAAASGVAVVVAAGNDFGNACNYSPARAVDALTVGATTSSDARASYSNYGSCVDVFAPGSSIKSAWKNRNNATKTISGTSMAAPHVAGVAAIRFGNGQGPDPSGSATSGVVSNAGAGSPNKLLFTPPVAGQDPN